MLRAPTSPRLRGEGRRPSAAVLAAKNADAKHRLWSRFGGEPGEGGSRKARCAEGPLTPAIAAKTPLGGRPLPGISASTRVFDALCGERLSPLHRVRQIHRNSLMLAIVDRLTRAVALYCGGVLLFVLMGIIVVDVTGRYVFNSPLYGSLDLSITLPGADRGVVHRLWRPHRRPRHRGHLQDAAGSAGSSGSTASSSSCLPRSSPPSGAGGCSSPDAPRLGSARARCCSTSRSSRSISRSASGSDSIRSCCSRRPGCWRGRARSPCCPMKAAS